jgi:hypothetical protein
MIDHLAVGIDAIHTFLAERTLDVGLPLSVQIRFAALEGDILAKRILRSGILNDPKPPAAAPAPKVVQMPTPAQRRPAPGPKPAVWRSGMREPRHGRKIA